MDLTSGNIVPVGARTQWEAGGPPPVLGNEVRAPAGVIAYEPADMTVTVGAGTTFCELETLLREHGQEVALDPRSPDATIGGILACGLSGIRRARYGPVRDHVLEVRFVAGYGVLVKGGGPTVKNVTGYDLPRLFVGSFGTLGVLTQATLRCRPRPRCSRWFKDITAHRPAARLWNGDGAYVLVEGSEADIAAQAGASDPVEAPKLPEGAHRGRISVAPPQVRALGRALDELGDVRWCAELGVGTMHVATDTAAALEQARAIARAHDGWMLREAGGGPDDDGFGRPLPNLALMRRIKAAFDPDNRCNPGRLPL